MRCAFRLWILDMGIRTRKAVTLLASKLGAKVQRCWHSGPSGFEKLEACFDYRG